MGRFKGPALPDAGLSRELGGTNPLNKYCGPASSAWGQAFVFTVLPLGQRGGCVVGTVPVKNWFITPSGSETVFDGPYLGVGRAGQEGQEDSLALVYPACWRDGLQLDAGLRSCAPTAAGTLPSAGLFRDGRVSPPCANAAGWDVPVQAGCPCGPRDQTAVLSAHCC